MSTFNVLEGHVMDRLADLDEQSVQTCITSPPYWGLRDYGESEQLGLEATPEEYVQNMVEVFRGVRRVLRDDGTLWLNLGDSYAGPRSAGGGTMAGFNDRYFGTSNGGGKQSEVDTSKPPRPQVEGLKPKDLVGIPWRVAFALQADGWYLRSDIIWHKPNPMPESVRDRPTKSHEYLFLLTKSPRYYYDADAIREGWADDRQGASGTKSLAYSEQSGRNGDSGLGTAPPYPGRNKRTVWTVTTKPFKGAHFAVFPPDLIEPCVLAGSSQGGQCADCGSPYERVTEKGDRLADQQEACGGGKDGTYNGKATKDYDSAKAQDASATKARILAGMVKKKTVGWSPTCHCGADQVSQLVLDPFTGSGTTGLVSLRHGRDFVGIELNPDYAQLARERIQQDAPLLNEQVAA